MACGVTPDNLHSDPWAAGAQTSILRSVAGKYAALRQFKHSQACYTRLGVTALRGRRGRRRRRALGKLAATFPGSLRELDLLQPHQIQARLDATRACVAGGPVPPWLAAQVAYHHLLHTTLAFRHWCRDQASVFRPGQPCIERRPGALPPTLVTAFTRWYEQARWRPWVRLSPAWRPDEPWGRPGLKKPP